MCSSANGVSDGAGVRSTTLQTNDGQFAWGHGRRNAHDGSAEDVPRSGPRGQVFHVPEDARIASCPETAGKHGLPQRFRPW